MATNRQRIESQRGSQQTLGPQGGSTAPARGGQVPSYPTTPPPLSRGDIADLAQRRRAATRQFDEAMASRERQQGRLESDFEQFRGQLQRQVGDRRRDAAETLGGRGLAMQPRGMGRELRSIRDWEREQMAEAEASMADRMSALEEAVREARMGRDLEHASVEADRARRQTELDRLMRGTGVL